MLITPSGVAYDEISTEQVVEVAENGVFDPTGPRPSSEWAFHLAAYRARPRAQAVVHCHSRFATALACMRRGIPAFHYMVAVAGGADIPCLAYATFGSPELAVIVEEGLRQRRACLLAHHGQIATGPSLSSALELAIEVESLAAQYCAVLAIGEPHLLGHEEMERVLKRFEDYGQPQN